MQVQHAAISTLSPDTSRRLARLGWIVTISVMLVLGYLSPVQDYSIVLLGCVMLLLSVWPALQWAERVRPWFPVFEISMLSSAPFYALPVLAGHPDLLPFGDALTRKTAAVFVGFQLAAIVAFHVTRGRRASSEALLRPLLPGRWLRYAEAGIWVYTVYYYIANFTGLIPYEFSGTLRAIFGGLGIACMFLIGFRLGAGDLSQASKFGFGFNLLVQVLLSFATLELHSGISLLLLAAIGYVSASRRLPLLALCVGAAMVAFLHYGKSEMRNRYWSEDGHHRPTLEQLPAFYAEWVDVSLTQRERGQTTDVKQSQLWERVSLFQMLCMVVDRVPEIRPPLGGESYIDLPALLVPRFMWPEKPSALESNVRLALHFHLVDEESAGDVSIAFGPVAEAYANFGLWGVLVFGGLLGWFMKLCVVGAIGAPQFSALGLFTILLTAWSFQVELVFATWVSSLFQASVTVIGIPLALSAVMRRS